MALSTLLPLLAVFSCSVFCQYDCPGGVIRFNVSQQNFIYPDRFNHNPPPDYTCDYQFDIPQGWYAIVRLFSSSHSNISVAPVTVIDQLNRTEQVMSSEGLDFYFIANSSKIHLETGQGDIEFWFMLNWRLFPTDDFTGITVSQNANQISSVKIQNDGSIFQIRADTKVSAISKTLKTSETNSCRGAIFFDGDFWKSPSLGTGRQLWNSVPQYVSSGRFMTIMNLGWCILEVTVQDYELTKNLVQVQYAQYNVTNYALDGSLGRSLLYSENDRVLVGLNGSGTLDVYMGTIKQDNLLASYKVDGDSNVNLPQIFQRNNIIFVMSGGEANLNFSYNLTSFQATKSFGRKGFIKSFVFQSKPKSINQFIDSPNGESAKISINVRKFDFKTSPTFKIMKFSDDGWTKVAVYNEANPPTLNTYTEFYAVSFRTVYEPIDDSTGEFFMEFIVDKSIFVKSVFGVLVMVLLHYLF